MNDTPPSTEPRLTSLSHGGGCGCKVAPGVLAQILQGTLAMPAPDGLLVGAETADDVRATQIESILPRFNPGKQFKKGLEQIEFERGTLISQPQED